jgi:hypothetical protein
MDDRDYKAMNKDLQGEVILPYITNCCEIVKTAAWDLYCKEAGMCAGAVDYWEQLSTDVQDLYICRILRKN